MEHLSIALLNDSFPPCIDGVANVVLNYAVQLQKYSNPVVFAPKYPGASDRYPFPVVHYDSVNLVPKTGYRVGLPFGRAIADACIQYDFDIIHCHCPFVSAGLTRTLQKRYHVPTVFTYHTKYDVDIDYYVRSEQIRRRLKTLLLNNINAFDSVWVVSRGAGESLKALGYQGEYHLMQNGVDLPCVRADESQIASLRKHWSIAPDRPVYLFVGRMMWYKGIRQILDGARLAKAAGYSFQIIFLGEGADRTAAQQYAQACGLSDEVSFAGMVTDRALLATYYSMARLLLFPSAYDTNGLVVREAAACSLPGVLLRDSSAAEGVVDQRNGFLISDSPEEMAERIAFACNHPEAVGRVGKCASAELYQSWESAVKTAYDAYGLLAQSAKANRR